MKTIDELTKIRSDYALFEDQIKNVEKGLKKIATRVNLVRDVVSLDEMRHVLRIFHNKITAKLKKLGRETSMLAMVTEKFDRKSVTDDVKIAGESHERISQDKKIDILTNAVSELIYIRASIGFFQEEEEEFMLKHGLKRHSTYLLKMRTKIDKILERVTKVKDRVILKPQGISLTPKRK